MSTPDERDMRDGASEQALEAEARRLEDELVQAGLLGAIQEASRADPLEVAPSASALVTFDEAPEELDPLVRAAVAAHLDADADDRAALAAVPSLGEPEPQMLAGPGNRSRLPLRLAAAAAMILIAILIIDPGGGQPADEPEAAPFSLTLEARRDGTRAFVPAGTRTLELTLVLGEELAVGTELVLEVERSDLPRRRVGVVRVRSHSEWGHPIIALDATGLPRGDVLLHVTAEGTTVGAAFALRLE